jgi:hypothetical protein
MRKLSIFTALLASMFVAACGGGDGFVDTSGGTIVDDLLPPPAAAVTALTSSPSIPSDPGQEVTITASVRDANNVALPGVPVTMSSDSGILTVADNQTNDNGIVTATLNTGGDPTNRTITVTAQSNSVTDTVSVQVIGTSLVVNGAASLAQGFTAPFTAILKDAGGNGIANQAVTVSSANGNTLSATSVNTDVGGQVQFDVTAAVAGADTISAAALGLTATAPLTVSDDSFAFTAPAAGTEIVLNSATTVTARWTVGGAPQANQTISFSTTRGSFTPPPGTTPTITAVTDANGVATVSVQSANAGPAVLTATNPAGTSTGVEVEFIATTPATIDVQASPFTIGPGEQSTITAIVRDAANNLVKNQVITFDLDDVTGGRLSTAAATTDLQGRATTFYTASSTTSANNGVRVTATVQSNTAINATVAMTVSQRELFISIGTGNTIFEPNSAQYRKEFVVQVTDSQGNGVSGVPVQVGILSQQYYKGFWQLNATPPPVWSRIQTVVDPCPDEDVNRNGVLDGNEDRNLSGRIEAGNVATAVAQGGTGGSFTTDAGGFGVIDVLYPQEFATWVDVTLEATATVQGTESAKASNFRLPINAEDTDDENESPPGVVSPFGRSATCNDTN